MWTKILERMYEERDAEELEVRIRNVIEERSNQGSTEITGVRGKVTREQSAIKMR